MSIPDAILERGRSAVDPFYDGEVPRDKEGQPLKKRYAVIYMAPGQRDADDLARTGKDHRFRWQVTSVGVDAAQARWVATRVRDAFLDARLVVDGWQVGVVEHTSDERIRRDDDLPREALHYAVDTYALNATR